MATLTHIGGRMKRGRTPGGLAAVAVLSIAALSAVVLFVMLLNSKEDYVAPAGVDTADTTPLVRVEDKTITRFNLRMWRLYHQLRAGKEGFVKPDHGILLDCVEVAARETILAKHGRPLTPEAIAEERARQIRESRDRETMQKILGLLDPYPGQFEAIMVRPQIAGTWIRKLHQSRIVQEEVYKRAEAGLEEAKKDPDAFFKSKEKAEDYSLVDSRKPPDLPGGPLPNQAVAPDHGKPHQEMTMKFAKDALGHTAPGELCPNVVDGDGAFVVARLKERTADHVVFEQFTYRKSVYDVWYDGELKKLKAEVVDPATRELLKKNVLDTRYGPLLFPADR
jgi:hypothetical protein